jgi:hypothetical protein
MLCRAAMESAFKRIYADDSYQLFGDVRRQQCVKQSW